MSRTIPSIFTVKCLEVFRPPRQLSLKLGNQVSRLADNTMKNRKSYIRDPLDQWFEDHPLAGGAILLVLVFSNVFLACLL